MPPPTTDPDQNRDDWKSHAPYKQPPNNSNPAAPYHGRCHCGRISYQLIRAAPLDAKFCHCRTCQTLHGAPFQWAAIFHKDDMQFTHGAAGLRFYSSRTRTPEHVLPCKVSCKHCGALIMDEGRNMVLVFPGLIEMGEGGRERFAARCHMFYKERVVDVKDGLPKWAGMPGESEMMED